MMHFIHFSRIQLLIIVLIFALSLALAQPFQWPEAYAATVYQGGTINATRYGDITTFNPAYYSAADDIATLGGTTGGPGLLYRDWVGNRRYQQDDGSWNMFWASNIEEVIPHQEYIITLREGWRWSDGDPMDVDDIMAAYIIHGDPEVNSNIQTCTTVEDELVQYEKISQYQYRIKLPKPIVNALSSADCGSLPSHVFMPVYEAEGAQGIQAFWGVDADISSLVSGGPYVIKELIPGERLIFERNPYYGEMVQAADGLPLPGPEKFIVHFVEDSNAELSLVITGETDYYYPEDVDKLVAISAAIRNGSINGQLYTNLGQGKLVDFITYNFNHADVCKALMFRDVRFRQAISMLINREELVEIALGGAGSPARDFTTSAAAPFGADFLGDIPFDPDRALELLASIGFTEKDVDGVLMNPRSNCRVEFNLQFNSGNTRRNQEILLISETAKKYGVKINPLEVAFETWLYSFAGDNDYDLTGQRTVNYDAQVWGLAGGDFDNPSLSNVFGLQQNLNAWNKSKIDIEPWEILLDRLTKQMNQTLDLDARVGIYRQRAEIMREYLPLTPLVAPDFYFYTSLRNIWPIEALNAASIEAPYRPGTFIALLMK